MSALSSERFLAGPSHTLPSRDDNERTSSAVGSRSNRFTLTDYVYDREDEPGYHTNAIAGPSTATNTLGSRALPVLPTSSRLPSAAASPSVFDDHRPSSWALGLTTEIAQIRTSTLLPSADAQHPTVAYPPPALKSPGAMPRFARPASPPSFGHPDMRDATRYSPPISLSPGPQISPSDNTAIKRLPPIPTSPSAIPTSTTASSSPRRPRPTLPATISSTSLTSSLPSPLLPAFQLNTKLNGSRPSLTTLPSSGTTSGLKGSDAELGMWEDPDRNKSVTFIGLSEKGVTEKEGHGRLQGVKVNGSATKVRILDWIFPESLFCRLLLGTVVFELVIDLIIEANILWRFNTEVRSSNSTASMLENKRRLPIFLIIFGLAHLWQLLLTMIAIRTKNTIQISAITIFNFAFLAWAVIQVSELRQILGDLQTSLIKTADEAGTSASSTTLLNLPLNVLTAVIIGVVAACSLVLSVLAYFVRREFGWQRYRFLGADLQIRAFYRRFQVFECLIYFAAFFAAGFGIQFIWLVLQKTDAEYIITWIMFPVSLILLVIGRLAAKHENKPFMIFFFTGLILGQAYFIFKLVRIWQLNTTIYANVSKSLTVFAILSLLSLTACAVWSALVFRDFGKGLKGAVLSQYPVSPSVRVGFSRWRSGDVESGAASSAAQKRLSID